MIADVARCEPERTRHSARGTVATRTPARRIRSVAQRGTPRPLTSSSRLASCRRSVARRAVRSCRSSCTAGRAHSRGARHGGHLSGQGQEGRDAAHCMRCSAAGRACEASRGVRGHTATATAGRGTCPDEPRGGSAKIETRVRKLAEAHLPSALRALPGGCSGAPIGTISTMVLPFAAPRERSLIEPCAGGRHTACLLAGLGVAAICNGSAAPHATPAWCRGLGAAGCERGWDGGRGVCCGWYSRAEGGFEDCGAERRGEACGGAPPVSPAPLRRESNSS